MALHVVVDYGSDYHLSVMLIPLKRMHSEPGELRLLMLRPIRVSALVFHLHLLCLSTFNWLLHLSSEHSAEPTPSSETLVFT